MRQTAHFLLMFLFAVVSSTASAKSIDQKTINQWIQQLGSGDFEVREDAMARLRNAGSAAIEALSKATTHSDLEIARRAEKIITKSVEKAMKTNKAQGYQVLGQVARMKNRKLSKWALGRLGQDADRDVKAARQQLQKLVASKDKRLAAKAQSLLRPPIEVLKERMLVLRTAMRGALQQGGRNQEYQKLYQEYRKVSREYRDRLRQQRTKTAPRKGVIRINRLQIQKR